MIAFLAGFFLGLFALFSLSLGGRCLLLGRRSLLLLLPLRLSLLAALLWWLLSLFDQELSLFLGGIAGAFVCFFVLLCLGAVPFVERGERL